jgi:hypothetical protein
LSGFGRVEFREGGDEYYALLWDRQKFWENFESFWEASGSQGVDFA